MTDILSKHIGNFTLGNVFSAAISLVICLIAVKVIMIIVNRAVNKLPIEKTLHKFTVSVVKAILYFISFLIVAESLGIDVTSLIAVFSLAGLAVSLSVQNSLSNLASGIMMLITKPFSVGDYIEAGGISGTVSEINFIYTKMLTPDNKIIFVPNSDVASSKITNYSAEPLRRVDINITASYDAPIEKVKAALLSAVKDCYVFCEDPAPFINVMSYQSSSIEYVIRAWCRNADYWTGYFRLLENVKKEFDLNGIEMTYDHLNVHMIKD
ncbi:MAG: mechanosensitive ion channel family protein [Clostridia bacterium]|jgi:small conductance mechanosensitive channel|nr:mechanosensitive ion channel family protein [Clostridia bacterium]MCI2000366.1 mechanosensitive ion channel family protein [Clostridia bacterium]MCI2015546.1 mechanosensitive ion channel family protein [Clostridia bacterium]